MQETFRRKVFLQAQQRPKSPYCRNKQALPKRISKRKKSGVPKGVLFFEEGFKGKSSMPIAPSGWMPKSTAPRVGGFHDGVMAAWTWGRRRCCHLRNHRSGTGRCRCVAVRPAGQQSCLKAQQQPRAPRDWKAGLRRHGQGRRAGSWALAFAALPRAASMAGVRRS